LDGWNAAVSRLRQKDPFTLYFLSPRKELWTGVHPFVNIPGSSNYLGFAATIQADYWGTESLDLGLNKWK
jgi:hypothetical protein